jgi:hypothetical protein
VGIIALLRQRECYASPPLPLSGHADEIGLFWPIIGVPKLLILKSGKFYGTKVAGFPCALRPEDGAFVY